jgi:hypothetical protein
LTEEAPTRRRFLVLGGALGTAAFLAWQVQGRLSSGGTVGAYRPVAFRPWQFLTLIQACRVSLDDEDAGLGAAQDLDRYFAGAGSDQVPDLALALGVLEFLPAGLRPRRFSKLSLPAAAEVLEAWELSSLGVRRQIARALRDAARFTWFSREETWDQLGYEGTWVGAAP